MDVLTIHLQTDHFGRKAKLFREWKSHFNSYNLLNDGYVLNTNFRKSDTEISI